MINHNKLVSIVFKVIILAGALNSYASDKVCQGAFTPSNSVSTEIIKSITVREHFAKLGVLKTEAELQQLRIEDKMLYSSMLDLEYSKAQEIMRLFATFPILTSEAVRYKFSTSRDDSPKKLKEFLKDSRIDERKTISHDLTASLCRQLSTDSSGAHFILNENFEDLSSSQKVERYREQENILAAYGIPKTMVKEIAHFFNPIKNSTPEFRFIEALFFRNFDTIALASERLSPKAVLSIAVTQAVGTTALSSGSFAFGLSLIGVPPDGVLALGATSLVLGPLLGVFIHDMILDRDQQDKLSLSGWVNRTKQNLIARAKQKKINKDFLALSGLDPKSIKPLPTVQQLKKQPESSLTKLLLPVLENKNALAYPEVDLDRLEDSLETQITLQDLDGLQPNFQDLSEISINPFSLLPYGIELSRSQNLVIGREDILSAKFSEISERIIVWQKKRELAETEKDKSWVTNEKSNLIEALSEHAKENGISWKYLTSFKKAVTRYDTYLMEVMSPHVGESQQQVDFMHENFQLVIFQIDNQFLSLKERAKTLATLIGHLQI